jgi:hypothetical protein
VASLDPTVTTEVNLRSSGRALARVETGFKVLRPAFPVASHVYVSVQSRGPQSVYHLLLRYQPLRVWYGDPSLEVRDPNDRTRTPGPEFLFWISPSLDVFEVDHTTFAVRGTGAKPGLTQYQKTLRTYALGLAAAGRTEEALRILLGMPGRAAVVELFDRRLAAALLLAAGERERAATLLHGLPEFDRPTALSAVVAALVEPVTGLDLDSSAMEAFGISPRDEDALRQLMRAFEQAGSLQAARRFATRLLELAPKDMEAAALRRRLSVEQGVRVTVPTPSEGQP